MMPLPHFPLFDLCRSHLSEDDDESFWSFALTVLFRDVETELTEASLSSKEEIYAEVGTCSHWLRPHQTRLRAAGGFAWPSGYGGSEVSKQGLPEFDWSVLVYRDGQSQQWRPAPRLPGKRYSVFRVALPTRTHRHAQATVNTVWLPRHPTRGTIKSLRFYGFRKIENNWQCLMPGTIRVTPADLISA